MSKVGTLNQGLLKVRLDYAPKKNGKKFDEWCKKYDFDPLNSGRRAWCSQLSTYFRDALGVAFNSGEMFLFYEEDLAEPKQADKYVGRMHVNATPDEEYPLRILRAYRADCDVLWTDNTNSDEPLSVLHKMMNESQKERADILDKAIQVLTTKAKDTKGEGER